MNSKIFEFSKFVKSKNGKNEKQPIYQSINSGNNSTNVQVGGDLKQNINIHTKPQVKKINPPMGSIGADPLLKGKIQETFNKLGEAREKRFGKSAYVVMYKNFKKDFGIKHDKYTTFLNWPKIAGKDILDYLEQKYNNTIDGRKKRASDQPRYISSRPLLYKMEKELLAQLGLELKSTEVKNMLLEHFNCTSHTKLSHLEHYLLVKHLEQTINKGLHE